MNARADSWVAFGTQGSSPKASLMKGAGRGWRKGEEAGLGCGARDCKWQEDLSQWGDCSVVGGGHHQDSESTGKKEESRGGSSQGDTIIHANEVPLYSEHSGEELSADGDSQLALDVSF